MAEFAPALFILFILVIFPMIDMIGVATGLASIKFASMQAAGAAAKASTFTNALSSAQASVLQIMNSGFGLFSKLTDTTGATGSTGANNALALTVIQTTVSSGSNFTTGPVNKPFTPAPTAATVGNYVYEYSATVTMNTGPFISMAPVPFLPGIPGLSKPATFSITTTAAAEAPLGTGY